MRIALISDLHGYLPPIEKCNLLLIAGDILDDRDQAAWANTSLRRWLQEVPADRIVATWGNHDFTQGWPLYGDAFLLPWVPLIDAGYNWMGLSIYGIPWTPRFGEWAWMKEDADLAKHWEAIPPNLDVLLVHGPPYGILDRTLNGEQVGSRTLRDHLQAMSEEGTAPKLVVCGHIHEGRGSARIGSTDIMNVSYVDRSYQPVNPVVYLEWKEDFSADPDHD